MSDETTAGPVDPGPAPKTPELDRMHKAREEGHSEDIGAFLDWLGEQGLQLCRWRESIGGGRWYEDGRSIKTLLADYFNINLDRVEKERSAFLAWHVAKSAYQSDQLVKSIPRTDGPAPTVDSWPTS